jgi:hypothetical protein
MLVLFGLGVDNTSDPYKKWIIHVSNLYYLIIILMSGQLIRRTLFHH